MSKELNHQCIICGKKYHHCDDCSKMQLFESWRTSCDTALHYQIYMIIREYDNSRIDKLEASKQLKNIGVTRENITELKQSVQDFLNAIFVESSNSEKFTNQQTQKKSIFKTI